MFFKLNGWFNHQLASESRNHWAVLFVSCGAIDDDWWRMGGEESESTRQPNLRKEKNPFERWKEILVVWGKIAGDYTTQLCGDYDKPL